ncbi:MAG TPA: hypothetical protein VNH82_00020 [Candidatus Dormibacteraeota bacterium]|nr:hypothetical protein [Candidatus Dormibacteraeota bacterium]
MTEATVHQGCSATSQGALRSKSTLRAQVMATPVAKAVPEGGPLSA